MHCQKHQQMLVSVQEPDGLGRVLGFGHSVPNDCSEYGEESQYLAHSKDSIKGFFEWMNV